MVVEDLHGFGCTMLSLSSLSTSGTPVCGEAADSDGGTEDGAGVVIVD